MQSLRDKKQLDRVGAIAILTIRGDGGVEFLVGQVEPGGAFVVKVGQGAFLQVLGAGGVFAHQARVTDGKVANQVGVARTGFVIGNGIELKFATWPRNHAPIFFAIPGFNSVASIRRASTAAFINSRILLSGSRFLTASE